MRGFPPNLGGTAFPEAGPASDASSIAARTAYRFDTKLEYSFSSRSSGESLGVVHLKSDS